LPSQGSLFVTVEFRNRWGKVSRTDTFFYTNRLPVAVPAVGDAFTLLFDNEDEDCLRVVEVRHTVRMTTYSEDVSTYGITLRVGSLRHRLSYAQLVEKHRELGAALRKAVAVGAAHDLTWFPLEPADFRWLFPWRSRP